jgi:sorbose reductase
MIQKYPDQVKNWLGDCPAGRFCKVWELKGVYLFLASMASSYVTGSDYLVDGGCYLPRKKGGANIRNGV